MYLPVTDMPTYEKIFKTLTSFEEDDYYFNHKIPRTLKCVYIYIYI